tara:strand:+ start:3688 stop:4668 length:981 start_codon:yes stop_codon:yes gene_type:complete
MNLVAVALNCTSDEYLHNITWSNIFDMGLIRDDNTVADNEHIDIFKITGTLDSTLTNLRNKADYALIVREGTYLRNELMLDFVKEAIKDEPDIIAFKNMNSFCFVVRLNHNWFVSGSDTFVQDVPVNTTIKWFSKEVGLDTFVKTDDDWETEHNYNLDLDRLYVENTEPVYKDCSKEQYDKFYSYDKTLYLLCAGNKPFITLTEYYKNNVIPDTVVFYDISKHSIEYYKEIYTNKETVLNQLPDSIDREDFWDWFESIPVEFLNKDIIEDFSWIKPGSSIWRSNIFTYLPTRIKYGADNVVAIRHRFEDYCKDNNVLQWKFLPNVE